MIEGGLLNFFLEGRDHNLRVFAFKNWIGFINEIFEGGEPMEVVKDNLNEKLFFCFGLNVLEAKKDLYCWQTWTRFFQQFQQTPSWP